MPVPKIQDVPGKLGNNKQVSPARKWCFTFNNYEGHDKALFQELNKISVFGFGKEIGEQGTPHLQGWAYFHKKVRPLSVVGKWLPEGKWINWILMDGSLDQNITYCSEDGDYVTNYIKEEEKKEIEIEIEELEGWQIEERDKSLEKPKKRIIRWIWSKMGKLGKSTFCKYMCIKHGALVLIGSANNIKNGICKWMEKNPGKEPGIIILDYPRSSDEKDFISYAGLEEIKNGCFFSPKFEGGMCIYNTPHVIVLANTAPDESKMSEDRWDIRNIDKKSVDLSNWIESEEDNDEINVNKMKHR